MLHKIALPLLFFSIWLMGYSLDIPSQGSKENPLIDQEWVRLGGPQGGLGYDIRIHPHDSNIMYVTDAWAGIHKSWDGGNTWIPINEGITTTAGHTGDAVPAFSLTIDPLRK